MGFRLVPNDLERHTGRNFVLFYWIM